MAKRKMCWGANGKLVKTDSKKAVKCKIVNVRRRKR